MTFIKICGITNLPDALVAIEAGADALGFNFYRRSPRYIDPSTVRNIIEQIPKAVLTVGVFVNEPSSETLEVIAKEARVSALQLHGDESPEFCAALSSWYVIKALPVDEGFDVKQSLDYQTQAIMLDAKHKQLRGGTGQVIDWSIARGVSELGIKVFLAGGLSADNVAEAIRTARPYAVDACSALEYAPGKKDHDSVKAFLKAAKRRH